MRSKISLYISEQKVDMDDQGLILFNYAQTDLYNPAVVKNSYSQEITLPITPRNNAIFGYMGKADRVTTATGFNPLKRAPFIIYNEMSEVLERGYVKVNSVDDKYHVSLYGGLGGFFYSLTYNDDGSKKSLADLYYNAGGQTPQKPEDVLMSINKDVVAGAWTNLQTQTAGLWNLINFAPAYNGYPACKFSADKAVYKAGGARSTNIPDLYASKTKDGVTYTTKAGCSGYILLEFGHKHTEMDIQDLRSYLQRPVISVKGLLEAFTLSQNTGEYSFALHESVTSQDNTWYHAGWMTLKMFDRDNLETIHYYLSDLLGKTSTPADYLIGFAKMFGFVFVSDNITKTITMMTRDAFYGDGEVLDIHTRIDRRTKMKIAPYTMDAKYYVWEMENFGELAKAEEDRTGKRYGSQWVDTNYEFSADKKSVLDGIPYKGAVDVKESDTHFFVLPAQKDTAGNIENFLCKFKVIESVSWKLYNTTNGETKEEEFAPSPTLRGDAVTYDGEQGSYEDFMSRVQLHGEDDKAEDGDNVLLFYNGMVETPVYRIFQPSGMTSCPILFHLSDDTNAMLTINNGQPCWDMSLTGSNIRSIENIPSFVRATQSKSFDFGTADRQDLYSSFWKKYIGDRFDIDTKVVTCKVDFTGVAVNASLLQRFFWFDNAVWVLNKISNYSLTTNDPVECEFIKVKEKTNYTNGQE